MIEGKINTDGAFTNKISTAKIGFVCQICEGSQEVEYYHNSIFPVCDNCKKALKELISFQTARLLQEQQLAAAEANKTRVL